MTTIAIWIGGVLYLIVGGVVGYAALIAGAMSGDPHAHPVKPFLQAIALGLFWPITVLGALFQMVWRR